PFRGDVAHTSRRINIANKANRTRAVDIAIRAHRERSHKVVVTAANVPHPDELAIAIEPGDEAVLAAVTGDVYGFAAKSEIRGLLELPGDVNVPIGADLDEIGNVGVRAAEAPTPDEFAA